MGRPVLNIDSEILYDILESGKTQGQAASELEVSIPTLTKRIAKIQEEQGILLQYRTLQSLQLTRLQAEILENITPQKIAEASLHDLVTAFKILKEKEHLIEGKPSEIKGLVGYLVEMEKQKIALVKNAVSNTDNGEEILEGEFTDESEDIDEDELPRL